MQEQILKIIQEGFKVTMEQKQNELWIYVSGYQGKELDAFTRKVPIKELEVGDYLTQILNQLYFDLIEYKKNKND